MALRRLARITASAAVAVVVAGTGLVAAHAASGVSANLLPNGSFDSGSVSGWGAGGATLSLSSPGYGGSAHALKVAWKGSGSVYTVWATPQPASNLAAGTQVNGSGEVMGPAGRKLCMLLQEHGTSQVITSCVTASGSWQALAATLTVKTTGDSVGFLIRQYSPKAGDSFQADTLSVTTGSATGSPSPSPTASTTSPTPSPSPSTSTGSPTPTPTPTPTSSGTGSGDPVIAAAGDIACDPANSAFHSGNGTTTACREKYTSDLLVNLNPAAVLALGDTQYNCASYQALQESYAPSWGRVLGKTHPVPGNHEYLTSGGTGCDSANKGAAGYFQYFGSAAGKPGQGYYSFDIGTWHIIALNSACGSVGGCGLTSPQGKWLANDLVTHKNVCTLAFWHVPLFSSGGRASSSVAPFWQLLYQYNADVVLNGHDHIYERFAPQTPSGTLDTSRGIREFIAGTGGAVHTGLTTVAANSEVRNSSTFGVLELTLHPSGYSWQFVPQAGQTFTDSGSGTCH